jgi:hypothetical protein
MLPANTFVYPYSWLSLHAAFFITHLLRFDVRMAFARVQFGYYCQQA